jgi:hypothetical protein
MTLSGPPSITDEQFKATLRELDWLKNNPDFEERPASIAEFLGPGYLNIDANVRPGLRQVLIDIFGEESQPYSLAKFKEAMMTGAIGIGKTTFASIVLPYMVHWVLCLKDPQAFFSFMPGSRIAFMMMSTSEDQAREVIFADVVARIKHSVWFKKWPQDPAFKNQIRWPQKDIWIVPGDSAETTFEGYNILGGVLDEMDSHRVTPKKDYALEGYNTISNRITSRFGDRGLLILIGQMKKSSGFAAVKYEEFVSDPESYVSRMTIWESFGWDKYLKADGTHDSFWFDTRRKMIVPDLIAQVLVNDDLIEIPNLYKKQFTNDPDKALKDLAGIPPLVGNPFIGMTFKIDSARERWHERFGVDSSPVLPTLERAEFAPWFVAKDKLKRVVHIDIAYSADGDALGIAMGHVRELKEIDGDLQPVIVFDMLLRMRPMPGREIILGDVRKIIYHLRDDLGFNIKKVTLDGFQSTDTIQQLNKRRFDADYLFVDRNMLPYQDLRDAIYEERIEFPKYYTYMKHGDSKLVEIAYQELSRLIDTGKKVDHPERGSKDVADGMAGVCSLLAGDRQYRRGVRPSSEHPRGDLQNMPDAYDPTVLQKNRNDSLDGRQIPSFAPVNLSGQNGLLPGGDIYDGLGIKRSK